MPSSPQKAAVEIENKSERIKNKEKLEGLEKKENDPQESN